MDSFNDIYWMKQALLQAQKALDANEVPVGAVLVQDDTLIAASHNRSIAEHDPSAHAEMLVLRRAGQIFKNYRLQGCTLYVTLEPCAMCAMALLHARVDRVVFAAKDKKTGAAGSVLDLFSMKTLNHQTAVTGGVLADECGALLKQFFSQKRIKKQFPLRDDALRTAEDRFKSCGALKEMYYIDELPTLEQFRLHYHYLEGERKTLVLCLHDAKSYSEQFSDIMCHLNQLGFSVLTPDLIGFGRSDKPKKSSKHTLQFHTSYLFELLSYVLSSAAHVQQVVFISSTSCAGLVQMLFNLCHNFINIVGVHMFDQLPLLDERVSVAPFPDKGHCAALDRLNYLSHIELSQVSLPVQKEKILTPSNLTILFAQFA